MPGLPILFLCLILATPLFADPCEDRFRAGLAAYARFDRLADAVEEGLYSGIGWASTGRVLARLEGRSARTSACDEVATHRAQLLRAEDFRHDAARNFDLAATLCSGANRDRAQRNIRSLASDRSALTEQMGFLDRLAARCAD